MLVTLDEYKAYHNINTENTSEDAKNTKFLQSAASYIRNYCDRKLTTATYEETFSSADKQILLNEYPIKNVIGVSLSTDYGQSWTPLVEFEDYIVDKKNEAIIAIDSGFSSNPATIGDDLKVEYIAGHDEPPEDLKLAAILLADHYKNSDYKPSQAFQGVNVENPGPVFASTVPGHIKRILNNYARI